MFGITCNSQTIQGFKSLLVEKVNRLMSTVEEHRFHKNGGLWKEEIPIEYKPVAFKISGDSILFEYKELPNPKLTSKDFKNRATISFAFSQWSTNSDITGIKDLYLLDKSFVNDTAKCQTEPYWAIRFRDSFAVLKDDGSMRMEFTDCIPLFIKVDTEPKEIEQLKLAIDNLSAYYFNLARIEFTYDGSKNSKIKERRKVGLVDSSMRIIIEPVYDEVTDFYDGLARVVKNDQVGFVNTNAEDIIPCSYEKDEQIITGAAIYYVNDPKGGVSIVIGADEKRLGFSEGLVCMIQNGKYGFINKKNEIVIPFQYDGADNFYDSIAIIKQVDKYGAIDRTGKIVIPVEYDLLVMKPDYYEAAFFARKNGECYIMDRNQKKTGNCYE
jgi:WG containing repeat